MIKETQVQILHIPAKYKPMLLDVCEKVYKLLGSKWEDNLSKLTGRYRTKEDVRRDTLVGVIGHFAESVYKWNSIEPFKEAMQDIIDLLDKGSDDDTDVINNLLDFKCSLITPDIEYNKKVFKVAGQRLGISPSSYKRSSSDTYYVFSLLHIENYNKNKDPFAYLKQDNKLIILLCGWASKDMLLLKTKDGPNEKYVGCYISLAQDLNPCTPERWKDGPGSEIFLGKLPEGYVIKPITLYTRMYNRVAINGLDIDGMLIPLYEKEEYNELVGRYKQ